MSATDPTTINDGQTARKYSAEARAYEVDFDADLAEGVSLASVTVTADPADGRHTLDNTGLASGSRGAKLRSNGGKAQKTYAITAVGVTDESPAQTVQAMFWLYIMADTEAP